MSDTPSPPPGQVLVGDHVHMRAEDGSLWPIETVKPEDKLRDDLVRDLMDKAETASKALAEFKALAFATFEGFLELVAEQYGAKSTPGGAKGNVTLKSYDGTLRIQKQVANVISFRAEQLQACKDIVDELLSEWTAHSQAELRAIVMNAFRVDKTGQINRGALLGLLRLDIQDARWLKAMEALRDSIQVDGTKPYIRFSKRPTAKDDWSNVSLDIATA